MKRIILLLICSFSLFSVSAQTVNGKKDKGFKTINTWTGKSVLPSYRSKNHLKSLKDKYYEPYRSKTPYSSDCFSDSKNKVSEKFGNITFFDLNYAYSIYSHHSFGLTFGQVDRLGYYISAMTGLNYAALNADLECDQTGYVDGEMQYYSGQTTNSRYSIIIGAMLRLSRPLALKLGVGYGERTLAWSTENGDWIRNSYYSDGSIDLNAGIQLFLGDFNMSFDFIGKRNNFAEFKIGIGFNIK